MFCSKCGKWIDYEAELCHECEAEQGLKRQESKQNESIWTAAETQNPFNQQFFNQQVVNQPGFQDTPQPSKAKKKGSMCTGLGLGITGFFFFLTAVIFLTLTDGVYYDTRMVLAAFAFTFFIPTLILGCKAINVAKRECRNGRICPAPTLVLGIFNVQGAIILFYVSIFVMATVI